ncbi:Orotate phosphoribosyltransferase [compost metagenome]
MLAIFTYEFDSAAAAFAAENMPLATLSNYSALIDTAVQLGKVASEDVAALQAWRKDPQSFGK